MSSEVYSFFISRFSSTLAKLVQQAHVRNDKCIVTGISNDSVLEGARIYPFSMDPYIDNQATNFWAYLKIFWPKEVVDAWHASLSRPSRTEALENILTMSSTVHSAWDANLFALKPVSVSPDQRSIDLEFHWLKKSRGEAKIYTEDLLKKPDFPSNLPAGIGLKFYDINTDTPIRSGHILRIKTNSPKGLPLPSKHLLDMRWHLGRVAAMSASALDDSISCSAFDDDDESNNDNDNDDDMYWYDDSNSLDSVNSEAEVDLESEMEDVVESIEKEAPQVGRRRPQHMEI